MLWTNCVSQIDNPGLKAFPVTVSLLFPTLLEYDFELSNYQVSVQEVTLSLTEVWTETAAVYEMMSYCLSLFHRLEQNPVQHY